MYGCNASQDIDNKLIIDLIIFDQQADWLIGTTEIWLK